MADQIGGALYALNIDNGTFHTGAQQSEQDFNRVKVAGDRLSATSGTVSRELGGVGRTALAVALGMGGLNIAVTGVKTALEGTITAAAAEAASQAQLRAAVIASGASYGDYAGQIDATIKKGNELGFTNEQTRSSLAILVAQTGSITEATTRYTTAQNLSRLTGLDVVTASRLLGKVTDENVTALQRYGIAVQKGSTEAEFFAAVNQKAAGQAQAFADSAAGQFAKTKIEIAEAGIAIGNVLLPGALAAANQTGTIAGYVGDIAEAVSVLGVSGSGTFKSLETGALALAAALIAVKAAEAGVAGASLLADLSTGGLAAVNPVRAGIIGGTVAIVGLDLAVRHFTGGGLIDYLDGATEAHKRAAAAAKEQGDTLTNLAALSKLGIGDANAQLLQMEQISEQAAKAEADFARAKAAAEAPGGITVLRSRGDQPGDALQRQLSGATATLNDNLDKAAQNVRDLHLSYAQLAAFAAANPLLGSRLAPDLAAAYDLLVQVKGAIGATADVIRAARTEFDKGLKLATDETERPNPVVEGLKTTLLLLEQEKRHLQDIGDTKGIDAIDAQIASLNNRIAETEAPAAIAKQSIIAFAAAAYDAAGQSEQAILNVKGGLNGLADQLTAMPESLVIDIATKLNVNDVVQVQTFLDLWKAGITVPIAFVAAGLSGSGSVGAGNVPSGFAHDPSDLTLQTTSKTAQAIADAAKAAADAAPNFAKQAAATGGASAAALQADADLVALAQAFTAWHAATGGSIDDFKVLLKLQTDEANLQQRLADAQTALNASTMEAQNQTYQLQMTYVAIAEEAARTGETVEQVTARMFGGILDQARSALDQILNGPTREGTQLQLKVDQLSLQRDLLIRGGADASRVVNAGKPGTAQPTSADRQLAAINGQITALEQEQKIRQDQINIMKDQATLADQTLRTDKDLAAADVWLTGVIGNLSGTVQRLDGAFIGLLGTIGATGVPIPKLAAGIDFVPHPMLAMLHTGEAVIPAAQNRNGAAPVNATFVIQERDDAAALRKITEAGAQALRAARRNGANSSTGSGRG